MMREEVLGIAYSRSVWSIRHPEVIAVLDRLRVVNKLDWHRVEDIKHLYREVWLDWIDESAGLSFAGCDAKQQWAAVNGIHEALVHQLAYVRRRVRDVITFAGDYAFYRDIVPDGRVITPAEIETIGRDDYVIVSVPNHEGGIPLWFDGLVAAAERVGFKIFLDCAFFGTIGEGVVDTSRACFDVVGFSLSKAFLCSGLRIGVAFGDDLAPTLTRPMEAAYNYLNANGVNAVLALLPRFSARFIPEACRAAQERICRRNAIEPCPIVLLGKSHDVALTPYFRAGTDYARFCLTPLLERELFA
jgi:hypothetical protein